MNAQNGVEMVAATVIVKGDVIEDPVGQHWITVHDVKMLTDAKDGAYSFFGDGPDERITFEGDELVKRRKQ